MADNRKLAAGILNLPASARQELAQRAQDMEREGVVGMLRKAGKEMYDNPIVNTAIGLTPVLGDIQATGETMAALERGAPWQETAGYAVGMLPFMPMLGGMVKKADDVNAAYRGAHTAPGPEFGAQLHDVTGGGAMYPEDIYSARGASIYGHGGSDVGMDKETMRIIQQMRNKPEEMVDIYRAVPNEGDITSINAGDWVTINPNYAKQHGESNLPEGYKILQQKVPAKSVWTNADSIHEYGYWPE